MCHILFVALRRFYTDTLGRPGAVVVHHQGCVLGASPEAESRGVAAGASLREAKAILREHGQYVPYAFADYRAARDAWLDRAVAYSDAIEPFSPAAAFIDLSGHPDPVDAAGRLLGELGETLAGLAPAKWVARLAAQPVDPAAARLGLPVVEPVRAVREFLAPLPTAQLTIAPAEVRVRLEFLGYRRIGQVARASGRALREQFGDEGLRASQAARGVTVDPVVPVYPPESVSERTVFAGPVEDREALGAALDDLAERLSARLRERDRLAERMVLYFEFEEAAPLACPRVLGKPMQEALSLRVGLRCLLDRAALERPPCAVRVVMPGLRRASRVQRSLWPSLNLRERELAADVAFRRVRTVYGDSAVQRANEVDAPRRERVLRAWRDATGWR